MQVNVVVTGVDTPAPDDLDARLELAARIMQQMLTEYTREWYGERCPDYEPECACCKGWHIVDEFVKLNNFD